MPLTRVTCCKLGGQRVLMHTCENTFCHGLTIWQWDVVKWVGVFCPHPSMQVLFKDWTFIHRNNFNHSEVYQWWFSGWNQNKILQWTLPTWFWFCFLQLNYWMDLTRRSPKNIKCKFKNISLKILPSVKIMELAHLEDFHL